MLLVLVPTLNRTTGLCGFFNRASCPSGAMEIRRNGTEATCNDTKEIVQQSAYFKTVLFPASQTAGPTCCIGGTVASIFFPGIPHMRREHRYPGALIAIQSPGPGATVGVVCRNDGDEQLASAGQNMNDEGFPGK
jgi:hypothetical protein